MKKRNKKALGFTMEEVMSGEHHFVNGFGPRGDLPFSFRVKWGSQSLKGFINPFNRDKFMKAPFTGFVDMSGFVTESPCEGYLELCYFSEGKIRYRFRFNNKGKSYEFIGEKRGIKPWNLHRTHTTCFGSVAEVATGIEISRSVTHFRLRSLPDFLTSFRLTANPVLT